MRVLVNVTNGPEGDDLIAVGFHREHSVSCSQCRCHYRVFSDNTASIQEIASYVPSIDSRVEDSHPHHPERIQF